MTANTAIHNRALLVWLTISTWTARRYDKTVTQKVNADYHASNDAGRYNKFLLPGDAQAYKTLSTLAGTIRSGHYGHTLAWSDEGWRILPTDRYMAYTTWFREQQQLFSDALDEFVAQYPTLRAEAQVKLNGLWKADDYPSTQDMRTKFKLEVQYSPVPATGDIRVDLASDHIAAIESNISNRLESAMRVAMSDAWRRLYTCVEHIAERLSDPDAIFRDSLIGNARELCVSLKGFNITNDPQLEAMRVRVEHDLASRDPDVLRDTPGIRQSTANKAAEIMDQMRGLYGAA